MKVESIDIAWIDPDYVPGWFAFSISEAIRDMQYFGCAGTIIRRTASQPIVARNSAVADFLAHSDSPWLWMVDADMVFDKGHPMKLWEAAQDYKADMVTGLAMIWKEGKAIPSLFYDLEDGGLMLRYNDIPPSGTEVAASGLASVLIHRRVLESLEAPRHPDFRWFDFLTNEDVGINGAEMTGTDVQFFMRARQKGFKLIVEPEATTQHLETIGVGKREWEKQWSGYSLQADQASSATT